MSGLCMYNTNGRSGKWYATDPHPAYTKCDLCLAIDELKIATPNLQPGPTPNNAYEYQVNKNKCDAVTVHLWNYLADPEQHSMMQWSVFQC